jgi:AraC-like DNA-binding protein
VVRIGVNPQVELLAEHRRVHSTDPDEARSRVGDVFCPHGLEPAESLRVRFNSVNYGAVGLNFLDYGGAVRIRPVELRSFVLVQVPLAGRAVVRTGSREIHSDTGTASVPDPDAPLDMRWGAGNPQLIVRIDRVALEGQLRRMLGREPDRPLRLDTAMDLRTPAARSWLGTVEMLRADAEGPRAMAHPTLRPQIEQLLMSQLLLAQPHTGSAQLSGAADPVVPRTVRRAEQLIVDHAREALTIEDIAEAVGVSVRALQEGFRRHLDTTPMARLREARLVGVHAELAAADPTCTTVSQAAADWGFFHLGRFSVAYRERWGESPSVTLRR